MLAAAVPARQKQEYKVQSLQQQHKEESLQQQHKKQHKEQQSKEQQSKEQSKQKRSLIQMIRRTMTMFHILMIVERNQR